jgi:hypothetical protein
MDDGIIDRVAVERTLNGDRIPLTPREVIAVLIAATKRGVNASDIARMFDRPRADWARRLASDHGFILIERRIERWDLLSDTTGQQARAKEFDLRRAGVSERRIREIVACRSK